MNTGRTVQVLAMVTLVAVSTLGGMALGQREGINGRVEKDRAKLDEISVRLADLNEAFRTVARVVEPSVVHITAKSRLADRRLRGGIQPGPGGADPFDDMLRRFFESRPDLAPPGLDRPMPAPAPGAEPDDIRVPQTIGAGSGWVWDHEGHIITNYHVVRHAQELEVLFYDRSVAPATVVGFDSRTDIAVLRVDRRQADLVPARVSTDPVAQGDMVFAFGSPFRFRFSMSQGIVSGKGRQTGILGPGGFEDFIQTDAAINPGNSGGPLTNLRGEVVGMNTAIATQTGTFSGIGLAIPSEMIDEVVGQLIERGTVQRGFLGAFIGDDQAMLRSLGVERGVFIDDVMADSPAEKGGLAQGDVVTAINGTATTSADQLRRMVARQAPGTEITLSVVRDGKALELKVTVGQLPEPDGMAARPGRETAPQDAGRAAEQLSRLGLASLRGVTEEQARRMGMPPVAGVLVQVVTSGSSAAAAGLSSGSLITHVMRTRVTTVDEMIDAIQSLNVEENGLRVTVRISEERSTMMFLAPPPSRE